ncbi:TRAP transporter small permease [Brevibacillus sp. B_LB10_24]|uniref:TRAP transporter small permease n=1 Tax=Brevibacillus sp. B_LB10_24 TaxID=3380645 RepID=UPI0038BDBC35
MRASLNRLSQWVDKLSRYVVIAFMGLAFLATIYQVFSRYALQSSFFANVLPKANLAALNFPWMEEAIRYLFIWIVFLGIGVVYKSKGHAQVEIVTNFFPSRWQRGCSLAVEVLNSAFFGVLLVKGIEMAKITNGQLSPSLHLNMSAMYASIMLCSAVCLIHSFASLMGAVHLHRKERLGEAVGEGGKEEPAMAEKIG